MSRMLRVTLIGLMAPFVLIAAAQSAQAERWHGADPGGDVIGSHYDPAPEPCGTFTDVDGSTDTNDDITDLTVRHTRKVVTITVGFEDLDPTLEQYLTIHVGTPLLRGWSIDVSRSPAGKSRPPKVTTDLSKEPRFPDPTDPPDDPDGCGWFTSVIDVSCRRLHTDVDLDADLVRVSVPRTCLRNPPWVRVGVTSTGFVNGADQTFSVFYDWWGTPEEGESSWLPPLSPPVPAGPGPQNG
ncbi:hypothetical protein ABLE68_18825 [Nocardioides sp. CN2-186]|uniref:hypothetical protein n=1 Tax=Nocardioides tweenelious TaxID=3156607 RepID=UPI0032B3A69F